MIDVESFSKLYGRQHVAAVDNISLHIDDGEIVGLAGLNGAGKTTTINAITGVILPSKGRILVDGLDIVKEKAAASRNIGWVSEYPSFEQNAKPVPLMRYFAGFHNMPSEETSRRIISVLGAVGLDRAIDQKLSAYSQGMKKRFGLASAMLSDPKNFLLDEILNGLDPEGINYVRNSLLKFRKEGKSILLSTHILGVLEDLADRVIILHRGRILETLTRDAMKRLGKPTLRLRVDRADDELLKVLAKFGKPVIAGDEVFVIDIEGGDETLQSVSSAIIRKGYRLSHLSLEGASLEEHFLKLIEENT